MDIVSGLLRHGHLGDLMLRLLLRGLLRRDRITHVISLLSWVFARRIVV